MYTLREASVLLNTSLSGLRKQQERGVLPTLLIKGKHYITEEQLSSMLSGAGHRGDFESLVKKWHADMLSGYHTGKPMSEKYANEQVIRLGYLFERKVKSGKEWVSLYSKARVVSNVTVENLKLCYASFKPDSDKLTCFYESKLAIKKAVVSFAKLLVSEGLMTEQDRDALIKIPVIRTFKNKPQEYDALMIKQAIAAASKRRSNMTDYDKDLTLTIVMLASLSGLRLNEMIGLRVEDVQLGKGVLYVRDGKNHKSRSVGISKDLSAQLKAYAKTRVAVAGCKAFLTKIDGTPMTNSAISQRLKRLNRYTSFTISAHKLRAAFCTVFLNKGVPAHLMQKIMGHSNIKTTMIYERAKESEAIESLQGVTVL